MFKLLKMKVILGFVLMAQAAIGEVWVAKCQNIQFNFDRKTLRALVYLRTEKGIFQIARGSLMFDNGTALRATLSGNPTSSFGPMTEIGLNKSRNIVYVLYRNPDSGKTKDGVFCETPIAIVP